jgi:HAE1 family hydrophobic/amphiphilic exporter-1/multidrug efflux pump
MISKIFINRPRLAIVISIVITIAGVLAMRTLPVTQYPSVTPPTISVKTIYPGANSSIISSTIAAPIETAVNGVENMIYMSSTSDNNGNYTLMVTFEVGTNVDIAQVNVQNRVQQALPKLPKEVKDKGVAVKSESPDYLGFFIFRSPNGTQSELFLSNYVDRQVKSNLMRIDGVSEVLTFSPVYSMRVWLDADRMMALGIGSDEVADAISRQNLQAVLGSVGAARGDGNQVLQYSLRATGRLNSVEEFEEIIIRKNDKAALVKLKDIAEIELGASNYSIEAKFNKSPAVVVAVKQTPGSNALDTIKDVSAELDRLATGFPDDVEYILPYDATEYVSIAIKEIVSTLMITFILVVIVCYLFLQDWRATLIPALTIPVSLLGTFALLSVLGFTINTLTLFALILAIGLVVDDAIVVVECVLRIMEEEGLDHKKATVKAMEQVTGAVLATTLVLLAIFVPVGFISGIAGRIYQQFAVTISIAVLLSTVNALTLSPALCAVMLNVVKPKRRGPLAWFNSILSVFRKGYVGVSTWIARRFIVTLTFLAVVVFIGFKFFSISSTSFLPNEDQGTIFVFVQLPEGATLPRTSKVVDEIDGMVHQLPGVKNVISIAGVNFMSGNGENVAFMVVDLDDWSNRKTDDMQIETIIGKIRGGDCINTECEYNGFCTTANIWFGNE